MDPCNLYWVFLLNYIEFCILLFYQSYNYWNRSTSNYVNQRSDFVRITSFNFYLCNFNKNYYPWVIPARNFDGIKIWISPKLRSIKLIILK